MWEAARERQALLEELLTSQGWQQVVAPTLRQRKLEVERRTMGAKTLDEVRTLQGAWAVLEYLLDAPLKYFSEAPAEAKKREE